MISPYFEEKLKYEFKFWTSPSSYLLQLKLCPELLPHGSVHYSPNPALCLPPGMACSALPSHSLSTNPSRLCSNSIFSTWLPRPKLDSTSPCLTFYVINNSIIAVTTLHYISCLDYITYMCWLLQWTVSFQRLCFNYFYISYRFQHILDIQ